MRDDTDLDLLAERLNATTVDGPSAGNGRLPDLLRSLAAEHGSDVLLVAGEPPVIRVHGALRRLPSAVLDGDDIVDTVLPCLPAHAQQQFRRDGIADAGLRVAGTGRFRVNLHHERGRAAASIRALPTHVPELASLGLPDSVSSLATLAHGLVLVGGAAGSGKSTTVAALVNEINRRDAKHIITIEDPIDYEHTNGRSVIEQIEIGVDAPDFPTALRAALRQAPEVIVIGEMRDPETMNIALAAGETGHLVFSTLHTSGLAGTVARIADSFVAERQPTIRQELAMALSAVFTQMLLPTSSGRRVPAAELLMVSYGARQHIRKNAVQHLHQEIALTRKLGSFSLEESLVRLVRQGLVPEADALLRATHPDEFKHLLDTLPH
ncbi:MAG: PilT/PilU family type 4a pilus ATPase [Vicinamibacterales bacterium]